MILYAKGPVSFAGYAFYGPVQKIEMRHGQGRFYETVRVDRIGMILRGDFYFPCLQIPDRMIAAAVHEFKFIGGSAVGQRKQLVPEADTEDGTAADQDFDGFCRLSYIFRVTGSVGQKDPVRTQSLYNGGIGVPGHDRDAAAAVV